MVEDKEVLNKTSIESPNVGKSAPMKKQISVVVFSIVIISTIVYLLFSTGGSNANELSNMVSMSKQEIINKYGSPDEIMKDEEDGYFYIYNDGFNIFGKEEGAYRISISKDMISNADPDEYKILDVYIDSSFDENVARVGTPDVNQIIDGKKTAFYLTQEDYLLIMATGYNSDLINIIRLTLYDESFELSTLDLSQLLGEIITEEELNKDYTVLDKNSSEETIMYVLGGFTIIVDSNEHRVQEIFLTQKSIYNLLGIRSDSSLDMANQILGTPSNTSEGVINTTRYNYHKEDDFTSYDIELSFDNNSKKISYLGIVAKKKKYVPEYTLKDLKQLISL